MIGIIGAMDEEVLEIKNIMNETLETEISNLKFYTGKIAGKDVVLAQSGIGKTLSAMTTTILLTNFEIEFVINVGTAGGIKSNFKTLDVIISNRVAQADFNLTAFGYKQNFSEKRISFDSSQTLIDKIKKLNLNNVYFGDIVSTDSFISTTTQVDKLLENFPTALCADMEAGSIAMTLDHFKIPFIIIRSISDVVGSKKDNAIEFNQYLALASKNSAKITKELLKHL